MLTRADMQVAKTEAQYLGWMEQYIMRLRPEMAEDEAHGLAARHLTEFMQDEGIEFGDPEWLWTKSAAENDAGEIWYLME